MDWSTIWNSLIIPVGVAGWLLSIASQVINIIRRFFYAKLIVDIERYWFVRSRSGKGIYFWFEGYMLITNKLGQDTSINKIVLKSKYSERPEYEILLDIEKDRQRRAKFEFPIGMEIDKVDGNITVIHTHGTSKIKIKAEYTEEKESPSIRV